MQALQTLGYTGALRDYILEGRPFLGICLGLQLLFEGSEENGGTEGLGIIPGRVTRFEPTAELPVPQIGWNQLTARCRIKDIRRRTALHSVAHGEILCNPPAMPVVASMAWHLCQLG